nr:MAG TPA: hypothetical protein [Caudoviricetes sp.]
MYIREKNIRKRRIEIFFSLYRRYKIYCYFVTDVQKACMYAVLCGYRKVT